MKRIFSVIVAAFMLVSLFAVNAFAADSKEIKLPFEMGIPSIEELSVFNNGSLFQFQFVDSEPYQNFWDKEKNHTYIRQLVDAGIERDSQIMQVDWALDSPSNWHYNSSWDTYDFIENHKSYELIDLSDGLFRMDFSKDVGTSDWVWKDVISSDVYTIETDESGNQYCKIDWYEHTLYIRARRVIWVLSAYGEPLKFFASPWSAAAAYGKNITHAHITKSDVGYPVISNLEYSVNEVTVDEKTSLVLSGTCDLVNFDYYNRVSNFAIDNFGYIILRLEGSFNDEENWFDIQFELSETGQMQFETSLYGYDKNTELSLRANYFCLVNDGESYYSIYSEVITRGSEEVTAPPESTGEPAPETTPVVDDKKDNKVGLIIAIVAGIVVVIGGGGAAVAYFLRKKSENKEGAEETK